MGTNDGRVVEEASAEETILQVAGRLRALSNNGLRFADNPYQTETFEEMLALGAELTALVDARPLAEIQRHFFDDTRYVSPYTVVDTAVFDDAGRILLIQRTDNGRWALPGGWCEVNELPAEGAVREVWEETGCRVALSGFLGMFDNNYHGGGGLHHLYCLLFAAHHVEGTPKSSPGRLSMSAGSHRRIFLGMPCTLHTLPASVSPSSGKKTLLCDPSTIRLVGSRSRPGQHNARRE